MMGKKADQEDKLVVELHVYAFMSMWIMPIFWMIFLLWSYIDLMKRNKVYLAVAGLIYLLFLIWTWLSHYSLVFDKEGCIKKFLFYNKKYTWDELIIRQEYAANIEDTYQCDMYREGVFFLTKGMKTKKRPGVGMYGTFHPFSSIVVNFKGTYMWGNTSEAEIGRNCEINKEKFFQKMSEWEVEINRVNVEEKNDLELPNQLVAQNDKKVDECRKIGVCFFIIIMETLGIISIILAPNIEGIFFTFICFLFCIWIIIMQWYTEYKVIIDKYGCTKTWWKYKKKYTWDELTIRKICSPMGNYAEGILFATYLKSPKEKDPEWYYYMHPFSSFTINFKGMSKFEGGFGDQCAVDKELLLQCFDEWGIELEDARKKENKKE